MNDPLSPAFQEQLSRRWGLQTAGPGLTWDDLRQVLRARVSELLDGDIERLVNIMYRLDIPEAKFHRAMGSETALIPDRLTELILEREKQRLQTWNFYKDRHDSSND